MKKKDVFVSTIKGLIAGIALWINNMSIASIILSTNSYDHVVEGLSNVRKKNNKDLWYVTVPLLIGICIGLLAGHHTISFFLKKWQLQTIILFVGLFVGGIRVIFAKQKLDLNRKNIFIPIIVLFIAIMWIIFMKNKSFDIENNILYALILGLISGISILVPGMSVVTSNIKHGYATMIKILNNLVSLNDCIVLIVFTIVCIMTLILFSKIVKLSINKNKNNTYIALCSCILANVIILIAGIKPVTINFLNIFTSILAFLWGYLFAKNVERE